MWHSAILDPERYVIILRLLCLFQEQVFDKYPNRYFLTKTMHMRRKAEIIYVSVSKILGVWWWKSVGHQLTFSLQSWGLPGLCVLRSMDLRDIDCYK